MTAGLELLTTETNAEENLQNKITDFINDDTINNRYHC